MTLQTRDSTDLEVRYYGTPQAEPVLRATPASLQREDFAAGSMGPKVDAACRFVEVTGDMAAIGRIEDVEDILEGRSGTIITPRGEYGGPGDLSPRHGEHSQRRRTDS